MLNTSFSDWPSYSETEINAIAKVLRSNKVNYWTGNEGRLFEEEFAGFTDCKYAVALANGTLAIDLALKFLTEEGDDVIVTSRTFIATVSSIINAGCRPVFADVDAQTQCLSASTIEKVLTARTKAIVVVHLGGHPADMDPIMELAGKHGIKVIEDCAQAHGARYKNRSVGSFGDVSAWSFCQDKIMTTGGEGGMVTTNDELLWKKMWSYKDHGKSWEAVFEREHPPGFRWLHDSFGTNWRMTEVQAAVGRIQLSLMPRWQAQRESNAQRIWDTCSKIDWLDVPRYSADFIHGAYKAYVYVRPDKLPETWNRDSILSAINELDVPVYTGSCSEVYLEKAFEGTGFRPAQRLPVARELGEISLMFLCHPTLTDEELDRTCRAIVHVDAQIRRGEAA